MSAFNIVGIIICLITLFICCYFLWNSSKYEIPGLLEILIILGFSFLLGLMFVFGCNLLFRREEIVTGVQSTGL